MKKQRVDPGLSDTWLSLQDQDIEWWPFQFLKPSPEERLSQRRVALLSVLHTLPITLLFAIVSRLDGEQIDLFAFSAAVCVGAHVVLWGAVAVPWNNRALRLSSQVTRTTAP